MQLGSNCVLAPLVTNVDLWKLIDTRFYSSLCCMLLFTENCSN